MLNNQKNATSSGEQDKASPIQVIETLLMPISGGNLLHVGTIEIIHNNIWLLAKPEDFARANTSIITSNSITAETKVLITNELLNKSIEFNRSSQANAEEARKEAEEAKAETEKAMELATTDFLTKEGNSLAFNGAIKRKFSDLEREEFSQVAILYFDLEKFKGINDTYGHEVGDKALQEFVKMVNGVTRGSERVFRIGGDEFVAILSGNYLEEAVNRYEKQARLVEFEHEGNKISFGVSMGAAIAPIHCLPDTKAMLDIADKNMLGDKKRRREPDYASRLESNAPSGMD